jgi:hypothetical protein
MHAAHAGKACDRKALAPTLRGLCPLTGARIVSDVLAGPDGVAVDKPGRERTQLSRDRGRGCFVHQSHTLTHTTGVEQGTAPVMQRQRSEVSVAKPPRDLKRLVRMAQRGVEIARTLEGEDGPEAGQIPVYDTLRRLGQKAFSTREPTGADSGRMLRVVVLR